VGASSRLTRDVHDEIVGGLRAGLSKKDAAERAGITEQALHGWLRKGREDPDSPHGEFFRDVERVVPQSRKRSTLAEAETGGLLARKARERLRVARLEVQRQRRDDDSAPPLLDFIERVSPHLDRPTWLQPLADALTRAQNEPVRLVINTPPQHGKSTLIFHWVTLVLKYHARRILYLAYNDDFAVAQMREFRPIIEAARVKFKPGTSQGYHDLRSLNGGTIYATGIGGAVTGRPGGIIVIDDPIKDWREAQSKAVRDSVHNWLRSAVLTRLHPDSSVVVVQTRWHEDDISGRLKEAGWQCINLPAIQPDGTALWPEGRPIEWLEEQRSDAGLGEWLFSALYQGQPRPSGHELFKQPATCRLADVPAVGVNGIGLDVAYTRKTYSDHSSLVVMRRVGGDPKTAKYYVVNVIRYQGSVPGFLEQAKPQFATHSCSGRWYGSTTEQGTAELLTMLGAPVRYMRAEADKYVRAQPYSAAWNSGRVIVPTDAPWSQQYIVEHRSFTGVNDASDDQVDAGVAAFDELAEPFTGSVEHKPSMHVTARWKHHF
jgi:predicted phage terminase large subunit-like protein